MATYPPRRLLGARPLPSDPRRDPRRSGSAQGGGGGGGRWGEALAWRPRPNTNRALFARRSTVRRSAALPGLCRAARRLPTRRAVRESGPLRPRPGPRPRVGVVPVLVRGLGCGADGVAAWVRPPGDAQRVCVCVCVGHPAPARRLAAGPRTLSAADLTAVLRSPCSGCGRLARAHFQRPATRCRHLPRSEFPLWKAGRLPAGSSFCVVVFAVQTCWEEVTQACF